MEDHVVPRTCRVRLLLPIFSTEDSPRTDNQRDLSSVRGLVQKFGKNIKCGAVLEVEVFGEIERSR